MLKAAGLREQVMIDVSHANSSKQHQRQIDVAADVAAQIAAGDARITGVMIESHLQEGRQDIVPGQPLQHGVSVTDACISLAQTVPVLQGAAAAAALAAGRCVPQAPSGRSRRKKSPRASSGAEPPLML
jgi:3-deoxy-7-phosphoheptulonate synthase